MTQPKTQPYYMQQHAEAVENGCEHYIDAKTGFLVFTELTHKARGTCCKSACRHCPYGFKR